MRHAAQVGSKILNYDCVVFIQDRLQNGFQNYMNGFLEIRLGL